MTSIEMTSESYITRDLLTARIDELRELCAAHHEPANGILSESMEAERSELEILVAFESECEQYCSDWNYGDGAMDESALRDYISNLIDDCYELPKSSDWPYRHMTFDFEAAYTEAKQDYTEIELNGETYYVR